MEMVAGVDEAGRGCLAGPVVAAAVILPRGINLPGVTDSKLLTPEERKELEPRIRKEAVAFSIAKVEAEEIDRINILQATFKAMSKAVEALSVRPNILLIDGNKTIPHPLPQKALVNGDQRSLTIGAASILAKVFRDTLMEEYHNIYPEYNFARHKGYATMEHRSALKKYGSCPIHRKTFKGVRETLSDE